MRGLGSAVPRVWTRMVLPARKALPLLVIRRARGYPPLLGPTPPAIFGCSVALGTTRPGVRASWPIFGNLVQRRLPGLGSVVRLPRCLSRQASMAHAAWHPLSIYRLRDTSVPAGLILLGIYGSSAAVIPVASP